MKISELAIAIAKRVPSTTPDQLMKMSFKEVALKVILPEMAGNKYFRKRIQPTYMSFMADYGFVCLAEDREIGTILNEIAMQRLSCGAVLHEESTAKSSVLPEEFREYASQKYARGCLPEPMDAKDYNFILKQMGTCCLLPQYADHAKALCFGLVQYLTPAGQTLENYMLGIWIGTQEGIRLYKLAHDLIMKHATDEERFLNWAKKEQWQRHLHYFARKWRDGELDFDKFLEAIGAKEGGFWQRWKKSREIKSLFKQAELPKGCSGIASR